MRRPAAASLRTVLALACAACASASYVDPWHPPAGGPTAWLTVDAQGSPVSASVCDSAAGRWQAFAQVDPLSPATAGAIPVKVRNVISASGPLRLAFTSPARTGSLIGSKACERALVFVPEAGAEYHARWLVGDAASYQGSCTAMLYRRLAAGGAESLAPFDYVDVPKGDLAAACAADRGGSKKP